MKKVTKQYRQGDVLLHPVDKLPIDAVPAKVNGRSIILAEGEATGHAHRIQKLAKVKPHQHGTELYLEVNQPVTLDHEEHSQLVIEPGIYHVRRQVEVWMDEVRQVAD